MNILDTILEHKKSEIAEIRDIEPKNNYNFKDFKKAISGPEISIIAEIKFKSPSEGSIYDNINPVKIAREYEDAGASALSVLTDRRFFGGSISYLEKIRKEVSIPIIQKDFIIHDSQIIQGSNIGADCFLLISEALERAELLHLIEIIEKLPASYLLEIHSDKNLRNIDGINPDIIGVNSRDLRSMTTDLKHFKTMYPSLPKDSIKVAESGIKTVQDIRYIQDIGYDAILIGTSLMKSGIPGKNLEKLVKSL